MCFFTNNQFRILVDGTAAGTDNLETIFEERLIRIGRVLTILDTWDRPIYLTRIWTIFEQHTAAHLDIPVEMVMPEWAAEDILSEIRTGEKGIMRVKTSLCKVHAEDATAWSKDDEEKVKALISKVSSFATVNSHVRHAMVTFIGSVVTDFMQGIVNTESLDRNSMRRSLLGVRNSRCSEAADDDSVDDSLVKYKSMMKNEEEQDHQDSPTCIPPSWAQQYACARSKQKIDGLDIAGEAHLGNAIFLVEDWMDSPEADRDLGQAMQIASNRWV